MKRFFTLLFCAAGLVQGAPRTYLFLNWSNVDAGDTRFPVDSTKVQPELLPVLEKTGSYYSIEMSQGEAPPKRLHTPWGINVTIEKAKKIGPWLTPDQPWEVRGIYEGTVLFDQGKFKLWYQAFYDRGEVIETSDKRHKLKYGTAMCYAESSDAVHWTKPALGLVEFRGSRENNMVTKDQKLVMGTIFIDPSAPAAERYKMVNPASMREFDPTSKAEGVLAGATSADGIHWNALPKPLWVGLISDTYAGAYYDAAAGKYVGYFRTHEMHRRTIGKSETKDFQHWPIPATILAPGPEEKPSDDYYTNAYVKYPDVADGNLMFVSIYHRDVSLLDIRLATSYDGQAWNWVGHEPIVELGTPGAWDSGKLYVCPEMMRLPNGLVAVPLLGINWAHNEFWRDYYEEGRPHAEGFGWAAWEDGRIAGIEAVQAGEFTTFPFPASGSPIEVNVRTSIGGSVTVECMLTGKAKGEIGKIYHARIVTGDRGWTALQWDDLPDPSVLANQKVRLRFRLYNAKVFGFRL